MSSRTSSWTFVLKRIGYSAVSLVGLSILIFVIARVLPGDPARLALGPRAPQSIVDALRAQLHLNDPIFVQYFYWIQGIFSGNWGISLFTQRNVILDVQEFLPATVELIMFAAIIDLVLAVPLGLVAGRFANSAVDNGVRVLSYLGIAVPSFVVAVLLQLSLGYGTNLFPVIGRLSQSATPPPTITGLYTIDSILTGNYADLADAIWHLVLPAFALALGPIAQEARIMRSAVVENLRKDYTLSEVSHGLPERTITLKYLMKPSLIPTITIYGLDISAQIANAFLIELIFNWPGFSRYGLNAMLSKDLNAIVAVVIVAGFMFAIANILVDIVVGYLDPRIRLQERSEE
ncbi:MAG: ABC transporter permease [Nitrososphaerales archaeon]|nr:ABC transporter permease [Nitrososphaerales archaeon]